MIRHVWSVLCRSSSIDRDANSLSLFDTLEEVTSLEPITEPRTAPIPFQMVTLWARANPSQPTRGRVRVFALNPGEVEPHDPVILQVDLTQHTRLRQRINFGGLRVMQAGIKEFQVQVEDEDGNWATVSSVPLEIKTPDPTSASGIEER